MYCLIATLGFDIDFVVRRLSRQPRPEKVVCLGLKVDDPAWSKVKAAFSLINAFCDLVKTRCVLEPIKAESAVKEIASILEREAREGCEIELYLTGGPRIAIVATLTAALLSSVKARVVVEGEAFDALLEIPIEPLRKLLSLSDTDRMIILEAKEPVRPAEVYRKLGLHKPAAYRKFRTLASVGLLKRVEGPEERYVIEENVRKLLELLI